MTHRYFVETPISGQAALLSDAEAHHLAHVMRLRAGAEVVLFDGGGAEFTARVEKIGKSEVTLAIVERHAVDRELRRSVTLLTALPRGDRQKWLVEKAVELGVRRFVPLGTERAVVEPDSGSARKLRRAVIEASKQCGRNVLMEVSEPAEVVKAAADVDTSTLRLLAQPGAAVSLPALTRETAGEAEHPVAFLIGPEGGFTPAEERAAIESGWRGVSLGSRILRIETAAALCCAWATLLESR